MKNELEDMSREEFAARDFSEKSALRERERKYYAEKSEEIGLKSLERFLQYHPNPSRFMKLGFTYAHRDLESVADAMANGKPWAVVSGLNPSAPLHIGHKAVYDEVLWLQEQGAEVFIPLTNDESFVVGKSKTLGESRKVAYEEVIPSLIAMGFDAERTHMFVDSDYPDIYNVAMDLSNKISLNRAFGVFGFQMNENPGALFYRSAVQIAQILLPQYEEFGGPKPTVVPVGIDQYPYLLLARDVAEKKGFVPPAGLFLKFLWGMDGKGKMSASREGSAIFLTENTNRAKKIIKTSYTGGSPFADFQRENGGIHDICPVYTLRSYHFEEDNIVGEECASGQTLCGDCKKQAIEDVVSYLEDHQSKLEEARSRVGEFILKTPIRSIFEE
ncbi:MAG: tryptophan--tRNA ligase [Nanoarchaeota archaeon]|nr:tryptophan--tRNA ligase [Nanoarchaeota archaeon]